jgi:hypothetical protein
MDGPILAPELPAYRNHERPARQIDFEFALDCLSKARSVQLFQ